MSNVTFDTSNYSDQLGVYDFFNVIIAGATFIGGLCMINEEVYEAIGKNITLETGLGMSLIIYIIGLILQEVGSVIDRYVINLYDGMKRRILWGNEEFSFSECVSEPERDNIITRIKKSRSKNIVDNPLLLKRYHQNADSLLEDVIEISDSSDLRRYEHKIVNGFVFSVCQYYVSVCGKDRKVEKMRALFAMSKTLLACFGALVIISGLSLFNNVQVTVPICKIIGMDMESMFVEKIILTICFGGIAIIFYYRAKKVMKRFLLILLGTYDAIVRNK